MDRVKLKHRLVVSRGCCAVCGKMFVSSDPDMHEVLITRGTSVGVKDIDIMSPQNCVLVCPGSCHIIAQHTHDGLVACIQDLLKYEGDSVVEWLEEMRLLFKSSVIDERIRLVNEVKSGSKETRS